MEQHQTSFKVKAFTIAACIFFFSVLHAQVVVYPAPAGEVLSPFYTVTVNGIAADVYQAIGQAKYGSNYSFCNFDFTNSVTIKITTSKNLSKLVIRPESYGIVPVVSGNTITVTLTNWRYFSVEPEGRTNALLIFANPMEVNPPQPGDPGVVYIGPGKYRQDINLTNRQTLYLAGGAVVEGSVTCSGNNIKIMGRGILCGNPWGHFGRSGFHINFNRRTNITIEGITIRGTWAGAMWPMDNTNTMIRNVKVCNGRFMNEDACSSYRSAYVTIKDSFFRSDDDTIPIKDSSKHIYVSNCVLWCDRARAICIGEESNPGLAEDMQFTDIDIIHWGMPALWFRTGNRLTQSNISFKNINISEDGGAGFAQKDYALHMEATTTNYGTVYSEAGWIKNITYENVNIAKPNAILNIYGLDANHIVRNIYFSNIIRAGVLLNKNSTNFRTNRNTSNIIFYPDAGFPNNSNTNIITNTVTNALAVWLKMDESSGLTANDSSSNTNNGNLSNMSGSSWAAGKIGGALGFDGDTNYVSINDNAGLPGTAFTAAMWIKRNDIAAWDSLVERYMPGIDQQTSWTFGFDGTDGSRLAYIDGSSANNDFDVYSGSSPILLGVWTHVALAVNGASYSIYVNGVLDGSGTAADLPKTTGRLDVGASLAGGDDYFNGQIDDFRLFGYALTRDAITNIIAQAPTNVPLPALRVNDITVNENGGTAVFNISLSNAVTNIVSVNYTTVNGTALTPSDYINNSGTITITPGSNSAQVSISIIDDFLFESNETFIVVLSSPTGATIADSSGVCTILSNDLPPLITATNLSVFESNLAAEFHVYLSKTNPATVTVNYSISSSNAAAGTDYSYVSGTLTFLPGSTNEVIWISLINDTNFESNETIIVQLSSPIGATLSAIQFTVTIVDDDPAITNNPETPSPAGLTPLVGPNPFHLRKDVLVSINNLSSDARAEIFNLAEDRIITLEGVSPDGELYWNLENEYGQKVSSGVYMVHIYNGSKEYWEKLIVVQ